MSRRIRLPGYASRPLAITIAAVAVAATGAAAATAAATGPAGTTAAGLARTGATGSARAAATAPACRAAVLRLQEVGTDTAVGSTAMTVAVVNRSASACRLVGYPALRLTGPGDAAAVRPGTGGICGSAAATVLLAPRAKASFFLIYRDFRPATGRPCAASGGLSVRLPGVPGTLRLAVPLAACGPVAVSALRPGAAKE